MHYSPSLCGRGSYYYEYFFVCFKMHVHTYVKLFQFQGTNLTTIISFSRNLVIFSFRTCIAHCPLYLPRVPPTVHFNQYMLSYIDALLFQHLISVYYYYFFEKNINYIKPKWYNNKRDRPAVRKNKKFP